MGKCTNYIVWPVCQCNLVYPNRYTNKAINISTDHSYYFRISSILNSDMNIQCSSVLNIHFVLLHLSVECIFCPNLDATW